MLTYILKRIGATVPTLFVVSFVIFSLMALAGGDPARVLAGDQASLADLDAIRDQMGLNDPFILRYLHWLGGIMTGDLGTSILTKLPVVTLIGQRLEATLSLTVCAMVLSVGIGLPLGIWGGLRPRGLVNKLVEGLAVFGFSVPVFVLAYLLIWGLSLKLHLLPVMGFTPISEGLWPFLSKMFLPSLALTPVFAGWIARVSRDAVIDVLDQDYIRTARSKGMSMSRLVARHVMRNAAVPIVTVVGMTFAALVSGVVVTEAVFAIPGLGRLTVDAISQRDYPVIQGVVVLMSLIYILVNLLVDICYVVFDPRITY
ncbi:ABC transporter permease [Celeribacter persicus]|uniref:Peptide/nickel transport system permease protein n=1 Tax=Celeribacter persicus TaxID=1651082 RepID=A0A2T5HUP6_9RHOB|nr:ABC transporter permease [Celeribacter persicus]PTQ75301.1 peptide/nickel transport system permease protein [Celeribacter persicus]